MTFPRDTNDVTGVHRRLGEPLRVLVVDDDEVDRELVRRLLAKAEIHAVITEAIEPMAAIGAVRRAAFDLIILDYNFPKHDGLFVLRELRDQGSQVPVVALTGQDDTALAVELMKAGAADYIAKGGLTAQRLSTGIRHALRMRASDLAARAVQDALHSSDELLRRLLESANDCILVLDLEGHVLMASPRGLEQLAMPDIAAARARLWQDSWGGEHRIAASAALTDAKSEKTTRFVGYSVAEPQKWWRVVVGPVSGPDGRPERALAVCTEAPAPQGG